MTPDSDAIDSATAARRLGLSLSRMQVLLKAGRVRGARRVRYAGLPGRGSVRWEIPAFVTRADVRLTRLRRRLETWR